MSYILDALNKSEQERREQEQVPNLQAIHQAPPAASGGKSSALVWALFTVLVLVSCAAAYVWFQATQQPPQATAAAPSTRLPQALAQSAASTPDTPAATEQRTPAARPHTPTAVEDPSAVSSLYRAPLEMEAREAPAPTVPPAVAHAVRTALAPQTTLPSIRALDPGTRARLPNMYYSAHIFSNEEGKGFAIINDRSRYQGDVIGPGLFVQEVREEGVVLNFEGQSFLLEALTDWPN